MPKFKEEKFESKKAQALRVISLILSIV